MLKKSTTFCATIALAALAAALVSCGGSTRDTMLGSQDTRLVSDLSRRTAASMFKIQAQHGVPHAQEFAAAMDEENTDSSRAKTPTALLQETGGFNPSAFPVVAFSQPKVPAPSAAARHPYVAYQARQNGFRLVPFKPNQAQCNPQSVAAAWSQNVLAWSSTSQGMDTEGSKDDSSDDFLAALRAAEAQLGAAGLAEFLCRLYDALMCIAEASQRFSDSFDEDQDPPSSSAAGTSKNTNASAEQGVAGLSAYLLTVQACAVAADLPISAPGLND